MCYLEAWANDDPKDLLGFWSGDAEWMYFQYITVMWVDI